MRDQKKHYFMIKQKLSDWLIQWMFYPLIIFVATGFYTASSIEIKVATVATEGSGWMSEMRAGAELITDQTE